MTKGQLATIPLMYVLFGFLLVALIVIMLYVVGNHAQQFQQIPPDVEQTLVAHRFVNTPECFAYQDQHTGRVYAGMLDIEKFTDQQLQECYQAEPLVCFRINHLQTGLQFDFPHLRQMKAGTTGYAAISQGTDRDCVQMRSMWSSGEKQALLHIPGKQPQEITYNVYIKQ